MWRARTSDCRSMFGQASHEKNTNGETALRPRQGFLDETAHYFAYPANLDQGEITDRGRARIFACCLIVPRAPIIPRSAGTCVPSLGIGPA